LVYILVTIIAVTLYLTYDVLCPMVIAMPIYAHELPLTSTTAHRRNVVNQCVFYYIIFLSATVKNPMFNRSYVSRFSHFGMTARYCYIAHRL